MPPASSPPREHNAARDRATLRAFAIILIVGSLSFLAYAGWTTWRSVTGHLIASLHASPYTVEVRRRPFEFSLLNPAHGHLFPGYVSIELFDEFGRELSSYSVNWDSFYPDAASIEKSSRDEVIVRLDGAPAGISCHFGPAAENRTAIWTVSAR